MKILIADKFESHGRDVLSRAGYDVSFEPELETDALLKAMEKSPYEVLVVRSTRVTADMMKACPALRMIIRAGSGYDTIDVTAAAERRIHVCNCPGQNSVAVAELTMGLMIALDRRIVDETDDLRRGVWNKKRYSKARGLKGRTLGIIGLGRIGFEVARRAAAFEMELLYSDPIPHEAYEKELPLKRVSLKELYHRADFISLHVPGGDATHHMIGAEELAAMKETACVINCSRGGVVDEVALANAVADGVIAGAALDVYEIEPSAGAPNFEDPIGQVAQVYGTHHVGASTVQAQLAVADEVVKIIRTYADTGRCLNSVNASDMAV
ncbi:MAG: NAD(P)-dependent oxidoreductase [Phycisphaerae bacterium]